MIMTVVTDLDQMYIISCFHSLLLNKWLAFMHLKISCQHILSFYVIILASVFINIANLITALFIDKLNNHILLIFHPQNGDKIMWLWTNWKSQQRYLYYWLCYKNTHLQILRSEKDPLATNISYKSDSRICVLHCHQNFYLLHAIHQNSLFIIIWDVHTADNDTLWVQSAFFFLLVLVSVTFKLQSNSQFSSSEYIFSVKHLNISTYISCPLNGTLLLFFQFSNSTSRQENIITRYYLSKHWPIYLFTYLFSFWSYEEQVF